MEWSGRPPAAIAASSYGYGYGYPAYSYGYGYPAYGYGYGTGFGYAANNFAPAYSNGYGASYGSTRLTAMVRLTGVTEPPITPLSDAISMPLLSVSDIIVIGTKKPTKAASLLF